MYSCKLHIQLDRDEPAYILGESITGEVVVDVTRATTCNALKIECGIKISGRCNSYQEALEELVLHPEENWEPGQYFYPFDIQIESLQATYTGRNIKLGWHLSVTADIDYGLDITKESEFKRVSYWSNLDRLSDVDLEIAMPRGLSLPSGVIADRKKRSYALPLIGLAVLAFFMMWFSGNSTDFLNAFSEILSAQNQLTGKILRFLFYCVIWGIPTLIGILVLTSIVQNFFGKENTKPDMDRILGKPRIYYMEKGPVFPGQQAKGSLSFKPTETICIENSVAKLGCYELIYGPNSSKSRLVHSRDIEFSLAGEIKRDQEMNEEFEFEIPEYAPASFSWNSNILYWQVWIRVNLVDGTYWQHNRRVKVVNDFSESFKSDS